MTDQSLDRLLPEQAPRIAELAHDAVMAVVYINRQIKLLDSINISLAKRLEVPLTSLRGCLVVAKALNNEHHLENRVT